MSRGWFFETIGQMYKWHHKTSNGWYFRPWPDHFLYLQIPQLKIMSIYLSRNQSLLAREVVATLSRVVFY